MNTLTIPEAAKKYGLDVKRLRGIVWRENCTGELELPIGCYRQDKVVNDWRLAQYAESMRAAT